MKVEEHQSVFLENILSYKSSVKKTDILKMIEFMCSNISVLGTELYESPVISLNTCFSDTDDVIDAEFLLPVNNKFENRSEYSFKPYLSLSDTLKIRHNGKLEEIFKTEKILNDYIKQNNYSVSDNFYYTIVKCDALNDSNNVIDISIEIKK